VKWIGTPGTASEGVLGLVNLKPDKPLWDFPLSQLEPETAETQTSSERRRWPRVKCSVSVELHISGESVIWGKASDLSQGGCFIEMAIPLHDRTLLRLRFGWVKPSCTWGAGGQRATRFRKRRPLSGSYFRTPEAPAPFYRNHRTAQSRRNRSC
jgi:hypothetical protein